MEKITVESIINAPVEKVWQYWNEPEHITKWAFASDDWEAPTAQNDLRAGGRFITRMQAKDKSTGFDFEGTYTAVEPNSVIEYRMDDGRMVKTVFAKDGDGTKITQAFDPENENPIEMQRGGWQGMLNNFKKYVENS